MKWQDREHFFAMTGRLMRRILVDFARHRPEILTGTLADKRGYRAFLSQVQPPDATITKAGIRESQNAHWSFR